MKNWMRFVLVIVFVVALFPTLAVFSQGQVITGGSVGVRAGEIAQAVMVALTSLLMTWMSRA